MGCRCSKPELDAFEREERLLLEHAAQSEKVRLHLQRAIHAYWNKEGKGASEVDLDSHLKVCSSTLPTLSKTKWKGYLTRRILDIVMNTAHRKGTVYGEGVEKLLREETAPLVSHHLEALEGKDSYIHLWRLVTNEKKVSMERYGLELSQKINGILESIYRNAVHHIVSFNLQKVLREEDNIALQSTSTYNTVVASCGDDAADAC
mmetsp:Transcript_9134/g.22411  ORF Transcript_9134/g.22411 Transcript_9134/m.22411 type:complete len:205 (+) Transcript_9134:259-873(+)